MKETIKKILYWVLFGIGVGACLYILLTVCGIIQTQIDIAVIVAFIPLYYALFFSFRDDIKGIRNDVTEIKTMLARHDERVARHDEQFTKFDERISRLEGNK